MNIKEKIETTRHIKVLAMCPIQCRLWTTTLPYDKRKDQRDLGDPHNFLRGDIHVAYLYQGESHGLVIGFWPGITGYESSYVDSALAQIEEFKKEFVSTEGMFGPTKWEHENWTLNAGNSVYKKLTTTYGDMWDAIQELVANQKP